MADEVVLPIPNLDLPQQHFVLSSPQFAHLHPDARAKLLAGIEADRVSPHPPSSLCSR
jgi:26S proteasome regulatory subunit N7